MNSNPDMLGQLQNNNKQIGDLISESESILGSNRLRLLNIRISQNKLKSKNEELSCLPIDNEITDLRLDDPDNTF